MCHLSKSPAQPCSSCNRPVITPFTGIVTRKRWTFCSILPIKPSLLQKQCDKAGRRADNEEYGGSRYRGPSPFQYPGSYHYRELDDIPALRERRCFHGGRFLRFGAPSEYDQRLERHRRLESTTSSNNGSGYATNLVKRRRRRTSTLTSVKSWIVKRNLGPLCASLWSRIGTSFSTHQKWFAKTDAAVTFDSPPLGLFT
ncbi:hypothetical protein B0T21DRAFT_343600 [Apiosordaria backusii]|uniref:Uncharacterized protein n=1 Tax=Apiosordaria backusii TaxID=314023 RepID=A0AA40EYX7_9PEZI|nr:hypothetical protein B0T21DRAFT_343600 [Apiosordaria backusii]